MSKGGGGGTQPTETKSTVNQSSLPAYAEPYFKRLMDRTEAVSNEAYIPYEGERVAGIGEDTEAGLSALRELGNSAAPEGFAEATTALSGVAGGDPLAQQAQYDSLGSFTDEGVAQQYMNPYISNVLNTQQDRLNQRFGEQQLGRNDAARAAGAFGGDRRFVQDQIANRELNMQSNEMDANALAAAYESGANIFAGEQGRELQNRGLNTDIFSGNRQGTLDQQRNQMAAAEQLRQQGLTDVQMQTDKANLLTGIGGVYDDQRQQGLDVAYSDFLNQRDAPRQQLNFYSGIMRGVPVSPQTESTQYNAPPSQLSQLLGLGVGGLGLAKALGS
tara:strand:+ start:1400 stop:2392 length:993 start_codon:yes stop_codon:yes gene_type:complete